ncbi:MAG: hypothetical protein JETT_2325 [Candidatus Jettenia ecosi]|uniref:Uncharacterized protein n=1 Tax=Candidatus Jettenia ecosi TaxID=2494326 RepID=A0A533Q9Q6_9BACT|nr:MAG: hypothetical protein JETT_2325 [Candidatus Jettenia ecosi]
MNSMSIPRAIETPGANIHVPKYTVLAASGKRVFSASPANVAPAIWEIIYMIAVLGSILFVIQKDIVTAGLT